MKKIIKTAIFTLTALFVIAGAANVSTINADAATKTTTKTTTKKSTKVKNLKKAAKTKTTTKKTTKKNTKKYNEKAAKVTQLTTTQTTVVTKTKAKKQTITTTVKTTVKTTKEDIAAAKPAAKKTTTTTNSNTTTSKNTTTTAKTMTIDSLNGKVAPQIIKAFKTMNYKLIIDPSVSYQGYFNGSKQTITLKSVNEEHLLHELGHYAAFIAGNKDLTAEFKGIYNKEASKFTGNNKAYVTKNSSEYFAESFRDFYTRPATLKNERPETYNYIIKSINSITDARINYVNAIYYA